MFGAGGGGFGTFGTFGTYGTTFGTSAGWIGGFGPPLQRGTACPKWRPTREEKLTTELGESPCILMSISAMEAYKQKSYEELRVEDYLLKRRSSLAVGVLVPALGTLAQQQQLGTGTPKWQAVVDTSDSKMGSDLLMSISAMEVYSRKSFEELRVEDYSLGRRSSYALGILRPTLGPPIRQQQQKQGTGKPHWQATVHTGYSGMEFHVVMSISAMQAYKQKSYEELRVEDYLLGRRSSLAVGILCPTHSLPARQQRQPGTGELKWQATVQTDDASGRDFNLIMSISAMGAYEDKSHEELRIEDYLLNRRHCNHGLTVAAAPTVFGAVSLAPPPAPSIFGGSGATQGPVPLHAAGGFNFGAFNHFGFNPVFGGLNAAAAVPAATTTEPPPLPVQATVAFGTAALAVEGLFGEAPEATGVAGVIAGFVAPVRRQQGTGTRKWRATKHPISEFGSDYDMIMSVSGMEIYDGKSHEELRAEDHSLNRKNSATAAAPTAGGGGGSADATAAATATAAAATAPAAGMFGGFRVMPANAPAPVTACSARESRCLNAVTIALNQACEGGDTRWIASTLELQLVSLEFCRACRSVPTLHVCIRDKTPRSLWSSDAVMHSNIRRWELRTSRVPTVCALSLSWELGTEMIAKELWSWLEFVQLEGPYAAAGLGKVIWPRRIKTLVFSTDVDTPLETVTWPPSLQGIAFGGSFNKPVVGVAWPPSLQTISFGHHFDQAIAGVVWPATLQHLSFGDNFDQPITDVVWPKSLKRLLFGVGFDQPVSGVGWPASLQQLSFGYWFDQSITGVVWPPSLQRLSFGCRFNQPVIDFVWSVSMQSLTFGETFDQPIAGVAWPPCLRRLSFGCRFNQPIVDVVWPPSMQQLSFGNGFNQSIAEVVWPGSLEQLEFGDFFDKPISAVVWPTSLRKLTFGCFFNRPIAGVVWPASLQELSFGDRFNHPIAGVVWPASLKKLSFKGAFNHPIDGIHWPASLEKLAFGEGFCQPMEEFTRQRLSSLMF